jgi:hypothetical protein
MAAGLTTPTDAIVWCLQVVEGEQPRKRRRTSLNAFPVVRARFEQNHATGIFTECFYWHPPILDCFRRVSSFDRFGHQHSRVISFFQAC